jgi:hypothetical protein
VTGVSDSDWTTLATDWQAQAEAPSLSVALLLRRERRRRLLMALLMIAEALISVAALVWSLVAVRSMPPTAGAMVVLAVVLYIAMVWGFALWNRRGTWHPLTQTIEGFLGVSLLRCRRGLLSARFAFVVASIQLGVTLFWLTGALLRSPPPADRSRLLLALGPSLAIGLGFLVWAAWYRRLMGRKLVWLEQQSAETPLSEPHR